MDSNNEEALELERRLRILLPETYEVFDAEVRPTSMGSAGLKYGPDGKVLWNEMWGSFCDLAMAGGPPHRGKLLEPSTDSRPEPQRQGEEDKVQEQVYQEICRGITLVTGLCAEPSPVAGWVRMYCTGAAMAAWLMRSIVMENVSAAAHGLWLDLPAGPAFRVEKEVKNVITAVAKTCHYWQEHMSEAKHDDIARLLARMQREGPLLQPCRAGAARGESPTALADRIAKAIGELTGLEVSNHGYACWLGIGCRNVPAAIWMMRALAVGNVLSRREGTVVFMPVDRAGDSTGDRCVQALAQSYRIARDYRIFA